MSHSTARAESSLTADAGDARNLELAREYGSLLAKKLNGIRFESDYDEETVIDHIYAALTAAKPSSAHPSDALEERKVIGGIVIPRHAGDDTTSECCVRALEAKLSEIEQHCPCGARPETPNTHPHVGGCPVEEAIRILAALKQVAPQRDAQIPSGVSADSDGETLTPHIAGGRTSQSGIATALNEAQAWLRELFYRGLDLTRLAHVKAANEAKEFAERPTLEEAADVLICVAGSAIHFGWAWEELAAAIHAKVAVNRQRTWERADDGTFQHSNGSTNPKHVSSTATSVSDPNPCGHAPEQKGDE